MEIILLVVTVFPLIFVIGFAIKAHIETKQIHNQFVKDMEHIHKSDFEFRRAQALINNWESKPPNKGSNVQPPRNIPVNCKNCGAPLHGHKCKFCDTEY